MRDAAGIITESGQEPKVVDTFRHAVKRRSGRGQHVFEVMTLSGSLILMEPAPVLAPLLAIGLRTHAGNGATEGFGRFAIQVGTTGTDPTEWESATLR